MIGIIGSSVYLELYGDSPVIGSIEMSGGKMNFQANYLFPEYHIESSELRKIADKIDELNKGLSNE